MCNIYSTIAISISKDYTNYPIFEKTLNSLKFECLAAFSNELVHKYATNNNKRVEYVEIAWGDLTNTTNVKVNSYGKKYDGNAPKNAAQQIVNMSKHYIIFGMGDYNLNLLAKTNKLEEIVPILPKRYKF